MDVFKNLMFIKKVVIIYTHPIISMIKLNLTTNSSSVLYQKVYSHIIVLFQNLGPLLSFVLISSLVIYNLI